MRQATIALAVLAILAAPLWAQSGQGLTAFERAQRAADLERQRTQAQVTELLGAARTALAAQRYTEAEISIQTTRRLIKSANVLTAEEQAARLAEVDLLGGEVVARVAESRQGRQKTAAEEIAERERQRLATEKIFDERQTESQWAQLRQFESRGQYDQALEQAQALLHRQPGDAAAQRVRQDLEYQSQLAEQIVTRQARSGETRGSLVEVEDASIPYTELHRYPDAKKWEEMSVRRLTRLARELGYEVDPRLNGAQLEKRIDLNVTDVGLTSVLTYLSEAGGVEIIADPHVEADTSVKLIDQTVTLNVKQLTVRQILDMIIADPLGWRVEDGHVVVSSKDKANPLKTITYPIQHMTAEIPDFGATVPLMNRNLTAPDSGGGAAPPLFGNDTLNDVSSVPPQDKIKELIVRFVKGDHVAPWEDQGGTATIEYYNGTLIISQTEAGHRKVTELLARL